MNIIIETWSGIGAELIKGTTKAFIAIPISGERLEFDDRLEALQYCQKEYDKYLML